MNRFIEISRQNTTEYELAAVTSALTLFNPAYDFAVNQMGVKKDQVQVEKHIYLYETQGNSILIPRGFFHDSSNPQLTDIENQAKDLGIFPIAEASRWKSSLNLHSYQLPPVNEILDNKADIIVAPCGTGKSVCGTYLIAKSKLPVIIIVHANFLVNQWTDEIERFTNIKKIVKHENHTSKYEDAEVCIATVQSLGNMSYEKFSGFYDHFKLAIFDEVHLMGAITFHKAINNFKCKRIGLTATPERTDKFKSFMWSVGPRLTYAHNPNEVKPIVIPFASGATLDPKKYMMWTRMGNKPNIAKLTNHLLEMPARNDIIINMTQRLLEEGRFVLLVCHRRETVQEWHDKIECTSKCILMGGSGNKKKETPSTQLVVATFQYIKTGFNYPRLDTIIFTTPFGAYNDTVQSVGRILRFERTKPKPVVIDIIDRDPPIGTNSKIGFCHALARKRRINYEKCKYQISNMIASDIDQLITTIQINK